MARAMMSLTTSLGRPFSAESCARPVTRSRFTSATPLLIQFTAGDKKSGVDPLSVPDVATGEAGCHAQLYQMVGIAWAARSGWPPRRSHVRLFPMFEK